MIQLKFVHKRTFCFLFCLLFIFVSFGQRTNFRIYEYNKENKLSQELVKSIQQDSLGIHYMATDEGILSLQNDYFSTLTLPQYKSKYFKELFKRKNGELFAVSDDAIYKVKPCYVKSSLELLVECNTKPYLPKYPKHFYEDKNNRLWITDFSHVYRYQEDTLIKYTMNEKNLTSSYARSFQFLECDNGNLIVVSQKGWFYNFNSKLDSFEDTGFKSKFLVHSSFKLGGNEFLLGTSEGIIKLIFDFKGNIVHREVISKEILASCFARLSKDKVLVGTWFQGLIELDLNKKGAYYPVGGFPYFTINDIYLDDFKKYWVATNSGVIVLEKKFFSSQFLSANSSYISSLTTDGNGDVYFAGRNQVYRITEENRFEAQNFSIEGSINILRKHNNMSLIGTEQGQLFVFNKEELLQNLKISDKPITGIESVSENEAWLVSDKELFRVDLTNGNIQSYLKKLNERKIVQDIALSADNKLYIAGEYKHSYLFVYDLAKDKIENLSVPFPFEFTGDFWVRDIEMHNDTLFLGTSSGLLKYHNSTIERLDIGEMSESEINSVTIDQFQDLWVTVSKGVVRKTKDEFSLFTPEHGLPSKTFTLRNLLVDKKGFLWVGTSNGLAFSNVTHSIPVTPKPIVYLAKGENKFTYPKGKITIPANSMLLMDVTATIYPQKQNQFEFCVVKGTQLISNWKALSSKNQILISGLRTGNYKICIRCKHEGNYAWSEHKIVHLKVSPVWYFRWYTILAALLVLGLLVFFTNKYSKKMAQKRLEELEKLISDRTAQLREANQSLHKANKAKDKFLSIIAHDLRNPFNAIRGFSGMLLKNADLLSEEERVDLLETIYKSSDDTFKLLESMLDWANVQKGNLKVNKEKFDVSVVLSRNLDLHKSLASLKDIEIKGAFKPVQVMADKAMIDTVIRNLISNAIKYSYPKQVIHLRLLEKDNMLVVEVADQGMGMDEQQVNNLFKIDTLVTSEGTANETGTGFGLMLCKEFVELNGGEIWVQSKKGNGTSFFFSVPKAPLSF